MNRIEHQGNRVGGDLRTSNVIVLALNNPDARCSTIGMDLWRDIIDSMIWLSPEERSEWMDRVHRRDDDDDLTNQRG